jgi:hypothetical protein
VSTIVELGVIEPELVGPEIRFEAGEDGDAYPHIYGPLNAEAVVRAFVDAHSKISADAPPEVFVEVFRKVGERPRLYLRLLGDVAPGSFAARLNREFSVRRLSQSAAEPESRA